MTKVEFIQEYLKKASKAYYEGSPIISDEQYDALEEIVTLEEIGAPPSKPVKHMFNMYSQQKHYTNEGKAPLSDYSKPKYVTYKLDGAAVSLLYVEGKLIRVLKRGDGIVGDDITDKFLGNPKTIIRNSINYLPLVQITGEIVAKKEIPNARNYASGALSLKSIDEFNTRELYFIAYDMQPVETFHYEKTLELLNSLGFHTVNEEFCKEFPHDGIVIRVNSNIDYAAMGYTSKHPRGSYALKERKVGVITTLKDVVWQVGKSGKVTPVAILEPVLIEDALVSRATLNNIGYIKALDLDIGDKVEVQRAGEIIPQVVRKISA